MFRMDKKYSARLRIDNTVEFNWETGIAADLTICDGYGACIAKNLHAEKGSYIDCFYSDGRSYSDEYTFIIYAKNGAVIEKTVKLKTFLPRISKEITNAEHPYLFINRSEIEKVKSYIAGGESFFVKQFKEICKNADSFCDEFEKTDVLEPVREVIEERGAKTSTIAVAWALTDNRRYAENVRRMLLLHAEYYEKNQTYIYAQHKSEARPMFNLAIAYDLIYGFLTESERKRIEDNYFRFALSLHLKINRGMMCDMGDDPFAFAFIGFLLKDDSLIQKGFFEEDYGLVHNIIEGIGDDGIWWEGNTIYHFARLHRFIYVAEAAYKSNYDFYNAEFSGPRQTKFYDDRQKRHIYRRPENVSDAENKSIKELFDSLLYWVYSNMNTIPTGDMMVEKMPFGTLGNMDKPWADTLVRCAMDLAYSRYGDEKYAAILNAAYPNGRENCASFDDTYIFFIKKDFPKIKWEIKNGIINKKMYNKEGCSVFGDIGMTVLRSGGGGKKSTDAVITWDNYDHHGHDHSDKLGISLYGAGQIILGDAGSYTYSTPERVEYAVLSVGHNVLIADETSQRPYENTAAEQNYFNNGNVFEHTNGRLGQIVIGPSLRCVTVSNDLAYESLGIRLKRCLCQIGDYVIDISEAVSGSPHKYDQLYRICNCEKEYINGAAAEENDAGKRLSERLGYNRVMPLAYYGNATESIWKLNSGAYFKITLLGGESTEFIHAMGPLPDSSMRQNMLFMRRENTCSERFITVLEPKPDTDFRTISDENGAAIITSDGTKDIIYYSEGVKENGDFGTDAIFAVQRIGHDRTEIAAVSAKYINFDGKKICFERESSAIITKCSDDCYRLDFNQSEENTLVTFSGFDGYKLFKAELKDDISLSEIKLSDNMAFNARRNNIYVFSRNDGNKTLEKPKTAEIG